jgi:capsular polysaccharide biosynthesis protein
MELRQYWQIIRRRLWVVFSLFLIVLAIGFLKRAPSTQGYQANMRFLMGLEPEAKTGDYYTYDKYYTWLTSEYLIDDASELVRSKAFAEAVSKQLASQGIQVPAGAIQGSTQAGQLHRILTISVGWGDAKELGDIANAIVAVLPGEIAWHFAQVGTSSVHASLIDPPTLFAIGASLKQKLDLPLRLFLSVVAGIALAFVLHYLDDSVLSRQELEQSGLNVLAELPPVRRPGVFHLPWRRLP